MHSYGESFSLRTHFTSRAETGLWPTINFLVGGISLSRLGPISVKEMLRRLCHFTGKK